MNSKKYGWPMADAVDYVAQQPENIVMGLTEGQIKRLRFQKFDHLAQSVLDVARKIYRTNINAFEDRNLKVMAKVSKEIGAKGELSSQARYINARFGLACERLTGGLSAYSGGFLKRKAVMLSVPESEAYPSLKPEPEFLLPS